MSTSNSGSEKEFQNGGMSGPSTQAPSTLENNDKEASDNISGGDEAGADQGEYAQGLALFLIVLGLGLTLVSTFLVALDMA